jgi:hypothetical protein
MKNYLLVSAKVMVGGLAMQSIKVVLDIDEIKRRILREARRGLPRGY